MKERPTTYGIVSVIIAAIGVIFGALYEQTDILWQLGVFWACIGIATAIVVIGQERDERRSNGVH